MERMTEVVPDADAQSLQHFLSNADWDHRDVVDQVARDADRHLGGQANSALYLDETGFLKKGSHSVGVQRQWIGRFDKVDNCQIGVFAALGCHERVLPINFRLYLPKEWVTDRKRCRQADVPKEQRVFKRKHDLALEMVTEARRQGVRFSWVGADGLYGEDPAWLRALDHRGEIFVVDVHKDQWIYPEDPAPIIPVEIPLLSCPDITTLLAHFLPRRDITEEEVIRQLQVRHLHRQSAIDSAHRKLRCLNPLRV